MALSSSPLGWRAVATAAVALALACVVAPPAGAFVPSGAQMQLTQTGPAAHDPSFIAFDPSLVYNRDRSEYFAAWVADVDTVSGEQEVYGQRLDAAGHPIGTKVRLSHVGPDGDPTFDAFTTEVAYDPAAGEYLVVWDGDTGIQGEREIWARRVDAATGAPLGPPDIRVSSVGPAGDPTFDGVSPAVAYNPRTGEYLVAFQGDDTAPGDTEIYVRRVTAGGTVLGTGDQRITNTGPLGASGFAAEGPHIAVDERSGEYLVAYDGNTLGEPEAHVQRLSASGAETGTDDERVTNLGPDGAPAFGAGGEGNVAWNPATDEYLVVAWGDDAIDNEFEVYGQRLRADGSEVGVHDFRISHMGPEGDTRFSGEFPNVATTTGGEYLVTWDGTDSVPGHSEAFGQRLTADAAAIGGTMQLSTFGSGPLGAYDTHPAYNSAANEYLVAYEGGNDASPTNYEIYSRRLAPAPSAPGPSSTLAPSPAPQPTPGPRPVLSLPAGPRLTAPSVRLAATQRVLRQGAIVLRASCAVACEVRATAVVSARGAHWRLRLGTATKLAAGQLRTVRLRIPRPAVRALRAALRRHLRLVAHVGVSARDGGGRIATTERTIRLR